MCSQHGDAGCLASEACLLGLRRGCAGHNMSSVCTSGPSLLSLSWVSASCGMFSPSSWAAGDWYVQGRGNIIVRFVGWAVMHDPSAQTYIIMRRVACCICATCICALDVEHISWVQCVLACCAVLCQHARAILPGGWWDSQIAADSHNVWVGMALPQASLYNTDASGMCCGVSCRAVPSAWCMCMRPAPAVSALISLSTLVVMGGGW
jgi:hypothetical protein